MDEQTRQETLRERREALNAAVGKRVRRAREEKIMPSGKKMTGPELAKELGTRLEGSWTAQRVSALETGKMNITVAHLVALSAVLDRPEAWFLGGPKAAPVSPEEAAQLDDAMSELLRALGRMAAVAQVLRGGREVTITSGEISGVDDILEKTRRAHPAPAEEGD
jgi:transcriptional regulator with XRE-family HTH domain